MTLKEKIKEYVDDHYKYYAFYPYDVEVDGKLYSYEEYMKYHTPRGYNLMLYTSVDKQLYQIKYISLCVTYIQT